MADISFRMDDDLKKQGIREQSILFEITREVPNVETLEAMREVEEMKKNYIFI